MRWLKFFLIMLATTLPALGEDWDTADGKTYKNVKVIVQEDDGVRVTYTGGVGKIPYYELSLELRKRFGEDYETLEAKRIAAEKALAEAIRNSATEAELKKLQDAVAAAQAKALAAASSEQQNAQTPAQPGAQATTQPGTQPSAQTTTQPGAQPSAQTTAQPGTQPSAQTTTQPGTQPSAQATAQPGTQPSAQTIARPGTQPSAQATARPGTQTNAQAAVQPEANPQSVQPLANLPAPSVEEKNPYPGSKFSYDESLDVCYLESPAADVFLVLPDAAPAAPNSPGQGKLTLKITTDGHKPEAPDQIEAIFAPTSAIKKSADNPPIKFLVDGTYLPVDEIKNNDDASSSDAEQSTRTTISFYLTPEQARSILKGKNVNFSVGSNNYRLDDTGISLFRNFFTDVDGLPPASTNLIRSFHKFIARIPSIITLISTVCEYIILGSFTILVAASIAAFILGVTRFIKM